MDFEREREREREREHPSISIEPWMNLAVCNQELKCKTKPNPIEKNGSWVRWDEQQPKKIVHSWLEICYQEMKCWEKMARQGREMTSKPKKSMKLGNPQNALFWRRRPVLCPTPIFRKCWMTDTNWINLKGVSFFGCAKKIGFPNIWLALTRFNKRLHSSVKSPLRLWISLLEQRWDITPAL
jgi:hypothetical protein